MPKESKTISHHNKQPYPESSTQQTNAKKNVEFVWESYEQQSPVKSKQHFPSPSNSSGGMTQLLGFQEDDPMNGFSFSTPSTSGELMNPFPTSDSDLKLSPPNTTTTAEDPFKKHNDLSSLTSASLKTGDMQDIGPRKNKLIVLTIKYQNGERIYVSDTHQLICPYVPLLN